MEIKNLILRAARWSAPSVVLAASFSSAFAEEWGFAYSGRLLEKDGSDRRVVEVGGSTSYVTNFYVRLYDDAVNASTNVLWSKLIENVPVKDGNFAFEVSGTGDNGVDLPDAFAHHSDGVMTIGVTPFDKDHLEIVPRQALEAVPYAALAGDARGTRGDIRLDGRLTAAAAKAETVTFNGSVSHADEVSFNESLVLPKLDLGSDANFTIEKTLVVSNTLKAANFSANKVVADWAQIALGSAKTLAASNLTVSGAVRSKALTPVDGKAIRLAGDVETDAITAAQIELNGAVNLFDFKQEVSVIPYTEGGGGSFWGEDAAGGYSWTAPARKFPASGDPQNTHNYFVSLSLCVTPGSPVTVKVVNGASAAKVAELGISGVTGNVWMPCQTFLKPGEKLNWTGGGTWTSNNVHLVFRQVGF